MKPHIRIFPHSQKEFASLDVLTTWLLTALKARDGIYLIRKANRITELPAGSLVLFRYGHRIAGEATVTRYVKESVTERTLQGQEENYEAFVQFARGSIRIYAPPIPVNDLQDILAGRLDITTSAQPYAKIEDWSVYPRLLSKHVADSGAFI